MTLFFKHKFPTDVVFNQYLVLCPSVLRTECVFFSARGNQGAGVLSVNANGRTQLRTAFYAEGPLSTQKDCNLCCEGRPSSARLAVHCVSRLAAVFTVSLLRHVSRVLSTNGFSSWNPVLAKSIFIF